MKKRNLAALVLAIFAMVMVLTVSPTVSGDMSADNMQVLIDQVKADKKLLVAANMQLTEPEAKGFWPVYENYQKDLMAINERIGNLIVNYAHSYMAETFTNEKAQGFSG